MEKFLELKDVSYSYHTLEAETLALNNINFSVDEGNFISIVGPSGCGKSTLLNLLSGLTSP
ncbi:MAG: ATP-binding cassette domain-containing protein, partial [Lachnospiraceae bacterium]